MIEQLLEFIGLNYKKYQFFNFILFKKFNQPEIFFNIIAEMKLPVNIPAPKIIGMYFLFKKGR